MFRNVVLSGGGSASLADFSNLLDAMVYLCYRSDVLMARTPGHPKALYGLRAASDSSNELGSGRAWP